MKLVRLGKGFCAWALLLFTFACCATVAAHAEDRKPEKRVSPVYPELAKRMRIGGVVRVAATIAPDGSVTIARATNGNKLLATAAEDAVKKWKFNPGAAEDTVNVDINFELSN